MTAQSQGSVKVFSPAGERLVRGDRDWALADVQGHDDLVSGDGAPELAQVSVHPNGSIKPLDDYGSSADHRIGLRKPDTA